MNVVAAAAMMLAFAPATAHAVTDCAALTSLALPNATVVAADAVPAGSLSPARQVTVSVPAFCRVTAVGTPTADSRIGFEVWVPSNWNGKLLGVGNGGYSSVLDYKAMADGLRAGYATVATDDGHTGEDLQFVVGHPGRIEDWADRAIHVMTEQAKRIVRAATGRLPDWSYFSGCSTGGFQGLAEAQRYPNDYDGIVAGAPGYPRLNLSASFMAAWAANHDADGHEILTRAKLPALNRAAVAACDGLDGITDGLIADPRQCRFDPATLLCRGAEDDTCLTQAQVEVVRAVYRGPLNPRTGRIVFPGWDPGSEAPGGDPKLGWTAYIVGQPAPVRMELWKFWVFGDPAFDYRTFDYDRDLRYANRTVPSMNAVSTDLDRFRAHDGKLLMYFGWADNVSSARTGIDYYESLRAAPHGATVPDFARLFLMPGVGHCGGGPGPDTFDAVDVLSRWVEHGEAPDRIVASHSTAGKVDRTRPLCPYPNVAHWTGQGSTDTAENFVCAPPDHPIRAEEADWLRNLQAADR